jgi:hypothetical protein
MKEILMPQISQRDVLDLAEFPAVVIAAFAVRNAGVLIVLATLAVFALGSE